MICFQSIRRLALAVLLGVLLAAPTALASHHEWAVMEATILTVERDCDIGISSVDARLGILSDLSTIEPETWPFVYGNAAKERGPIRVAFLDSYLSCNGPPEPGTKQEQGPIRPLLREGARVVMSVKGSPVRRLLRPWRRDGTVFTMRLLLRVNGEVVWESE